MSVVRLGIWDLLYPFPNPARHATACRWAARSGSGSRYRVAVASTIRTAVSRLIRWPSDTYTSRAPSRVRTAQPTSRPPTDTGAISPRRGPGFTDAIPRGFPATPMAGTSRRTPRWLARPHPSGWAIPCPWKITRSGRVRSRLHASRSAGPSLNANIPGMYGNSTFRSAHCTSNGERSGQWSTATAPKTRDPSVEYAASAPAMNRGGNRGSRSSMIIRAVSRCWIRWPSSTGGWELRRSRRLSSPGEGPGGG